MDQGFNRLAGSSEGLVEQQLRSYFEPGEVVHTVALSAVVSEAGATPELSVEEVGRIILPVSGQLPPRAQLVEGVSANVEHAANEHSGEVTAMAWSLGMIREETLPQVDLLRVLPGSAIWYAEGGGNRTSVVRRDVAVQAMAKMYSPENLSSQVLYQGGNPSRHIPRTLPDGKPNPEWVIAEELAGGFLPTDDSLTEFGLNVATAQAGGWSVDPTSNLTAAKVGKQVVVMTKQNAPSLVLVESQAQGKESGMEDGISAIAQVFKAHGYEFNRKQLVVCTNGQYRPRARELALRWARRHDTEMSYPIVFGDEAAFTVQHAGQTLTTAGRSPIVYLQEAVVLARMFAAQHEEEAGQRP